MPKKANTHKKKSLCEYSTSTPSTSTPGDLIQVYKILKGHDDLDIDKYFTLDHSNFTRNNGYKLIGKPLGSYESKHFFFNRVVNVWNQLPREVVSCNTIHTFKNHLDKYFNTNPRLDLFMRE